MTEFYRNFFLWFSKLNRVLFGFAHIGCALHPPHMTFKTNTIYQENKYT